MRYLLAVLLLAGCATPEERAARDIYRHGPYCEKLGYAPDTDAWRDCVLAQSRERRERVRDAAARGDAAQKAVTGR